jgi:hypothetical protein
VLIRYSIQLEKTKKKELYLFKIAFEKTFDKDSWDFLLEILEGRQFDSRWIFWIKQLLYNSRTSILPVRYNGFQKQTENTLH